MNSGTLAFLRFNQTSFKKATEKVINRASNLFYMDNPYDISRAIRTCTAYLTGLAAVLGGCDTDKTKLNTAVPIQGAATIKVYTHVKRGGPDTQRVEILGADGSLIGTVSTENGFKVNMTSKDGKTWVCQNTLTKFFTPFFYCGETGYKKP